MDALGVAAAPATTEDCKLISVTKADGGAIQCNMFADSTVQDLLDTLARADVDTYCVHKAHNALLEPVLLTESGSVMQKALKLSDYGLDSDSTVMMLKTRAIQGRYLCWVTVDTSVQVSVGMESFVFEIKDHTVTINGVEGTVDGDVGGGELVTATFSEPVTIKSSVPHSNAFFRASGCEFQCRSGNFSSAYWFPVEGKLLGTSVTHCMTRSNGAFKGRFIMTADKI